MHQNCHKGQYELAEKEKSFKRLIPYPCQLLRWQIHHTKDTLRIAKISSHMHGIACKSRCKRWKGHPTVWKQGHPKEHHLCEDKCGVIDAWIRKSLIEQLYRIIQGSTTFVPSSNRR